MMNISHNTTGMCHILWHEQLASSCESVPIRELSRYNNTLVDKDRIVNSCHGEASPATSYLSCLNSPAYQNKSLDTTQYWRMLQLFFLSIFFAALGNACAKVEPEFELFLANLRYLEAKGERFSVDDFLEFAKACVSSEVSVAAIDSELKISQHSRKILDEPSFHCLPYSSVNSSSATAQSTSSCLIPSVSPGVTIKISDCSSSCVGDQYLRLIDSKNNQLASNDDGNQSF